MTPTFAIIGAAGYVARKHAEAIRAVGGEIVAVVDPNDAVGWIDAYAPRARYFRDIAPFIAWCEADRAPSYSVICTPNDLHAGQAFALSCCGKEVIVEKPVALTRRDLGTLERMGDIVPILNARCSPEAERLRAFAATLTEPAEVVVRYVAPRGEWYSSSWKGDPRRSGGIVTNIGVHVLDLLLWTFGAAHRFGVRPRKIGVEVWTEHEMASARMSLSTSGDAERSITVNGTRFDLGDLAGTHVESYRRILAGKGWTLADAEPAIALCERLR